MASFSEAPRPRTAADRRAQRAQRIPLIVVVLIAVVALIAIGLIR